MKECFNILVVTSNLRVASKLKEMLKAKGWAVIVSETYDDGLFLFNSRGIDLVVMDSSVGEEEPLQLLKQIRSKSDLPVMVVADPEANHLIVKAFHMKADDVIRRPYNYEEAVCRVSRLLTYYYKNSPFYQSAGTYLAPHLTVDFAKKTVLVAKNRVELTSLEYDVLKYFLDHQNTVISRQELLEEVWGYEKFGTPRSVDALIQKIRKKLGVYSLEAAGYIKTEWKKGYRFEAS